ncbi:hypothetical protein ACOME3_007318 [Neoechinorhynchus agilis]
MQNHLRGSFLSFASSRGHRVLESISVIPRSIDPSGTYFVNSGVFRYREDLLHRSRGFDYNQSACCQKCIRLGGRHNDLSNVGVTRVHLTFFEMLGTWSHDSLKSTEDRLNESMSFAVDFLVKELRLDIRRLCARHSSRLKSVGDQWRKLGVNQVSEDDRLYWEMADTGPCGSSTELDYLDANGEAVELWNIVLIDEFRSENGEKSKLGQHLTMVDTGLGLERLTAIVTQVDSVFSTDVFSGLNKKIRELFSISKDHEVAVKIICDHLRTVCIAMADGLYPSPLGLGSQIRKLIERCLLQAKYVFKADIQRPFVHEMVDEVVKSLGSIYPELERNNNDIKTTIKQLSR